MCACILTLLLLNCNSLSWVYSDHAFNHFLNICWNEDWDGEMSPFHLKFNENVLLDK